MVEQSRETPAAHRSGEAVATKLLCIGAKARQERKLKFVNLYYLHRREQPAYSPDSFLTKIGGVT